MTIVGLTVLNWNVVEEEGLSEPVCELVCQVEADSAPGHAGPCPSVPASRHWLIYLINHCQLEPAYLINYFKFVTQSVAKHIFNFS